MIYFITGIDINKGSYENDSDFQKEYYELGIELATTNIFVKILNYYGLETEKHTIVTCSGREFFYNGLFKNVIDFKSFLNLGILKLVGKDFVGKEFQEFDYVLNKYYNVIHLYRCYREFFLLKNIDLTNKNLVDTICNFNLIKDIDKKFNLNLPFCCFVFRKRKHDEYRNLNPVLAKNLIDFIVKTLNLKVYVAGFDSEFLCDNKNIFYVNLQEYASLVNNKNCKFNFSTLTGIPHLTYFCGHSNLKNIILDFDDHGKTNFNQCMGKNINFKNVKTEFLNKNSTEEYIQNKMREVIYLT
jgi:hypothetical protein